MISLIGDALIDFGNVLYAIYNGVTMECDPSPDGFRELPPLEQKQYKIQKDEYVDACFQKEKGTYYRWDEAVKFDCETKFWSDFKARSEAEGGWFPLHVNYQNQDS